MVLFTLKKSLAVLSIVVLMLLTMTGGHDGLVLCVLPGGHIELEGVSEGCCDPSHAEKHSTAIVLDGGETGDEHCGTCVDIPLPGIGNCIGAGHGPSFSKSMPAGKITYRTLPVRVDVEGPIPDSYHHKTRHLASVRSVTLLI